jgi:DNA-binding transcriptional regulator LsrR (DeoR family)
MTLERSLMDTYGLKDAFIVPAAVNKSQVNAVIAEAASMYIAERLTENSFINMGYGDTPSRILNNLATLAESPSPACPLPAG